MATAETTERILDVAERLFVAQGIERTSMRQITEAADVALAAVNYHFRSKEGLAAAIVARLVRPMREEYERQLAAADAEPPDNLGEAVRAFLRPWFAMQRDERGARAVELIGRIYSGESESMRAAVAQEMRPLESRFLRLLMPLMPEMSPVEQRWRFTCMIGTLVWWAQGHLTEDGVPPELLPADDQQTERLFVATLVAMLAAPAALPVPASA